MHKYSIKLDSMLPSVLLKEPMVIAGHVDEAYWDHANTNNMILFYHVLLNDQREISSVRNIDS